ncbi:MAG: hypothetical protein ABIR94_14625 [Rubrivivax sp.]
MKGIDMTAEEAAEGRFEDYVREGAVPIDALRLWQLAQQGPLIDALRALFHGPQELVLYRSTTMTERVLRARGNAKICLLVCARWRRQSSNSGRRRSRRVGCSLETCC